MRNDFKDMQPEEQQAMLDTFLLSSWSYSKVTAFARNEKAFEMNYLYGVFSKSSSTTIAGQAYHHALQYFFSSFKDGVLLDIVELEQSAFQYIDEIPANRWKLQKTTPTIEECQSKANATVTALLRNFVSESAIYTSDIKEIIDVEVSGEEWVCVNGVEIPLPLHFKIDLTFITHDGKLVIADHKSKSAYTSEEELTLAIGVQAMTYIAGYEEKTGRKVNEVWFVENKYSANKDKTPQLSCFKLTVNNDTRKLYEALLYEPLKRMIAAVHDADYVYLINDSDNFTDKVELYDFWARTQMAELTIEDFNVDPAKKELIGKRLKKIRDASLVTVTPTIIKSFRENASKFIQYDLSNTNMTQEQKIEHILKTFNASVEVAEKIEGYSCDTYLLRVSAGVKVNAVQARKLDIANALDVASLRISNDLVMHNGKSYLPIEVPKKRDRNLYFDEKELDGYRLPLGKDNFGNTIVWDLMNNSTPHALICGATGSGKSVCIKSTIEYAKAANIPNIVIFDPKYEFTGYGYDGSTMVVNDIMDIEMYMAKMVEYMNEQVRGGKKQLSLIVFDEFADAVANARKGRDLAKGEKSLEENLRILLQKGRSVGIRVMAATQRASVKVITGDAKVNFPVQICFRVPKEVDSKVVLDEAGAECLAGMGDGLIKSPEYLNVTRFQAFYKPVNEKANAV